ncbi:hypothetical protein MAR_ORF283 [Marseillevirus marseillevirus]|uniref:Uncharacterized protein n=1 Tax=Marseillevirus marseillevirus TaxID=694581 RepID=D2XAT0_GBMV|nr:hypothetical protein MAR_ORF283 [Marseillevirus marseillevirus]ADB04057.1 hypothetical protein MAR_ORF283 [Marseillevirus marseillevirus]
MSRNNLLNEPTLFQCLRIKKDGKIQQDSFGTQIPLEVEEGREDSGENNVRATGRLFLRALSHFCGRISGGDARLCL